ncbi:hypothetical protein [Streptomyces wedmorensis]
MLYQTSAEATAQATKAPPRRGSIFGLMLSIGQRMQMCSWVHGAVGAAAGAELDAPLVEVVLEVVPLLRGQVAGFGLRPCGSAAGEELLVFSDHVLVEDRDVAAGGSDIEMSE